MNYIQGADRYQQQLLPPSIDEYVAPEAAVRVIDAFVDSLDLQAAGFVQKEQVTGRPSYDPAALLKLYAYGYLSRIRSSRRLETECQRNLEVIWLMAGLKPDHWTIAAFRREHKDRFKTVLREFNVVCRQLDLFGAELVAIDGAKFKAVNNRNAYHTLEQLKKLVPLIDQKIDAYVQQLEEADAAGDERAVPPVSPHEMKQKLARLKERRDEYAKLRDELVDSGKTAVALTDADSTGQKKVGVGYNVQIAVDAKHHLIAAETVVCDANDSAQLAPMAEAAQATIGVTTVVADAGYHERDQLHACEKANITTFVPAPRTSSGMTRTGVSVYPREQFSYDAKNDRFTCPSGAQLEHVGRGRNGRRVAEYYANPTACAECKLRTNCTTAEHRRISRLENEDVVERQAERLRRNRDKMTARRKIVEHVFGTMRIWGHDTFLCRGLESVRGEFSLTAFAYNLRRAINVLGVETLLNALKIA